MFYRLVNAYTRQFSFPYRGLQYFLRMAKWLNVANKTYTKKLPGNFYMLLNPTEHIQQQLFWYGYYEKELGDLMGKILNPGDVFLDIGANIGYFSLLAAATEPSGKVIAFEPAKDVYEKLRENISINNIKNIITVNAAVGEINEEKELFLSGADNLGMSSFKQPENFSGRIEKVNVLSIDHWLKISGLHKIDLVKIDVEGSELAVLRGMKDTLIKFKPLVIVEINPETLAMFNLSPRDIFEHLNQLNFEAFIILDRERLLKVEKELDQTKNVLLVHREKKLQYGNLFNVY